MMGHYKQGIFKPRHPKKYIGNVDNIVYRSGWENRSFKWLDDSPKIVRWSSEEVVVNYLSKLDGRVHKYFVDLYFEVKDKDGNIKKFLAEVKPYAQTVPPKEGKNKKTYINALLTYQRNQDKWKYCREFAKSKGLNFVILTEKNTGGAFL